MKAIKEETDGKLGKEGEKSFCLEAVCFLNEFRSMTVSEKRNWAEVTTQDHSVTDRIGPSINEFYIKERQLTNK